MKSFSFIILFILYAVCSQGGNINSIQKFFSGTNKVFHIKKQYDLKGDTLYIPEKSTLSFEGGSIENGTVMGPYGKKIYVKGQYKYKNANYYGEFFATDGSQLTYRLDKIKRPFKLYQPLMMWGNLKKGIEANHLNGSQGVFLVYHLRNIYNGVTKDSVSLYEPDLYNSKDNDKDIVDKIVKPLIESRVNVIGLMFHCESEWDDQYYSNALATNYNKYITHKVELLKKYFPNMKIIYISNEQPWFTASISHPRPSKFFYKEGWTTCLNDLAIRLHSIGMKVGFKFAGLGDGINSLKAMNKALIRNVDYFSVNFYPYSGTVDKQDLYNEKKIAGYVDQFKEYIELLKVNGKSSNITITETGILPYRESLPSPAQYKERAHYDNGVMDIHIRTIRMILSRLPYKIDFINYWFSDQLDKVTTRETLKRIYDGYLT